MTIVDGSVMTSGTGRVMVPRSVVVLTVLVLLGLLVFDLTAGVPAVPWHIPGHSSNPVTTAGLLGLIGSIVTFARGPRPSAGADDQEDEVITTGKNGS